MNYEKNVCPYDVGQLLTAKEVLNWAVEQEERVQNNIHNQTILGLIEDAIMNEVVRQVRILEIRRLYYIRTRTKIRIKKK